MKPEQTRLAKISLAYLPRGKWSGVDQQATCLEGIGSVDVKLYSTSRVFLSAMVSWQSRPQNVRIRPGLARADYLTKARNARGRFISGRFGEATTCDCTCYRIFFDVPEKDKARKRLEESLTRLKIAWKAHRGRSGEDVYFSSPWWSRFLAQCGRGAANKQCPFVDVGPCSPLSSSPSRWNRGQ